MKAPAELEGRQVEVDRAKFCSHKRVQFCASGAWETATREPVLGLCLQDQLRIVHAAASIAEVSPCGHGLWTVSTATSETDNTHHTSKLRAGA